MGDTAMDSSSPTWDPFADSDTEADSGFGGCDGESVGDESGGLQRAHVEGQPLGGGVDHAPIDLRPSVVVRLASDGKWAAVLRALGTGSYPINAPWDCNATVLHHAAGAGHAGAVAAALALGADPDCRDDHRSTPLHYACEGSDGGTCTLALLAAGASINATDSEWCTPLMLLVGGGTSCGVMSKAALLLAHPALHLDASDSLTGDETVEEAMAVQAGQHEVAGMIRDEVLGRRRWTEQRATWVHAVVRTANAARVKITAAAVS